MHSGKHLPNWIRQISDETQRAEVIESLTQDDVFRSQFRVSSGSPPSSLDILDWGLQHIDRLRKARYEQREKSSKTWQIYLTIAAVTLPILSSLGTLLLTQSNDLRIKGTERDITSKIEFLKLMTAQPDKKNEIIRNWKGVFPDDVWLDEFVATTK